jgi:hypothetical protein
VHRIVAAFANGFHGRPAAAQLDTLAAHFDHVVPVATTAAAASTGAATGGAATGDVARLLELCEKGLDKGRFADRKRGDVLGDAWEREVGALLAKAPVRDALTAMQV